MDKKLEKNSVPTMEEKTILISFKDGSYKKVTHVEWEHKQWIHFTKYDGKQIFVNPINVNYLQEM